MNKEIILSAKDVEISFNLRGRTLNAIRKCSLDLYKGETLAIVGESGSGKSVFTKAFLGMLEANGSVTGGSIMYHDIDLAKFTKEKEWLTIRGKKIAMVMQDPMTSLDPLMTVGKQIKESIQKNQGLRGSAAKEKAIEMLKKVGIPDAEKRYNQYPHEFSGGMRQRIGIARALIMEPEFIVADEPISALDVSIRAQVLNLLNDLKVKKGLTYLFIAHDLSVVRYISDRVAVIHKGRIVELAETEELFEHPLHPYTKALLSAVPIPNPTLEREKKLLVYNPAMHDYSKDLPVWEEIKPGHFVYGNQIELEQYRKELNNNIIA